MKWVVKFIKISNFPPPPPPGTVRLRRVFAFGPKHCLVVWGYRPGTFHFEIPVFKNEVRNTVGIGASLVHGN